MVDYIEESTGGNFKPTPEGQHEMICCRVIDMGTHKSEYQGEVKHNRKILISWEIPGVRTEIDGKDVPAIHSERFTWSFHEKANLRKFLENWRGTPFKPEDFRGQNGNGFRISRLVGVPCYAQIMHETGNNGRTYSNMTSIMRFPGKQEAWPKAEGDTIFFDLDNFDQGIFDKLSKRLKAQIAETPEGAELIHRGVMHYAADDAAGPGQPNGDRGQASSGGTAAGASTGGASQVYDDEIPFQIDRRL
ncbi:phage replication initiation protein, NGO0469 family [Falsirhodobacter halotolerans]|uniref:phage replication initiation protein, NGO0469 family n=1 Tax=Falsirhodobacter halotolerans TaxID=1146892 RepID=UPI001FD0A40A|nr:hypothetical protein [Falsirhodobacter halotolerans]MCJ8138570.1 hypothetical protein [Falsirhodobacter halotolerans]